MSIPFGMAMDKYSAKSILLFGDTFNGSRIIPFLHK
jgi:hypothetical protein